MNSHWTLLVVDVERGKVSHIDPKIRENSQVEPDIRSTILFQNYLQYLNLSKSPPKNNLQTINWTYEPFEDLDRPLQPPSDMDNCGPYVMDAMDHISLGTAFDPEFDPMLYRYNEFDESAII
ncbi:hypothetical protein QAD02_001880 [Eretmocerus hayati]|uniref:Uncharacterized protein n=1 Tax=Eretmocerus hayati TaxID=131215 RepID=A0ACC2NI96_9HYME|nr:hypothetical protein QAD02_001880 [Eretmocerus hayati]